MPVPTTGGKKSFQRKNRALSVSLPTASSEQKSPIKQQVDKGNYEKYVFKYNGVEGETIIWVKEKVALELQLKKATALQETGKTAAGKATHQSRGIKHGKPLIIYPKAPIVENGKRVHKGYTIQVPGSSNYNDVVSFLLPHQANVYAFKWGSTTSFFYNGVVTAAAK